MQLLAQEQQAAEKQLLKMFVGATTYFLLGTAWLLSTQCSHLPLELSVHSPEGRIQAVVMGLVLCLDIGIEPTNRWWEEAHLPRRNEERLGWSQKEGVYSTEIWWTGRA